MDKISKKTRSWNMSRIRSSDTSPELRVRRYLYHRGYRYRIRYQIKGKPDIAFPGRHVAVFVNGCFWHGHDCKLFRIPKTRTEFWVEKIESNRKRDKVVDLTLSKAGWKILRIWECEMESDFGKTMARLEDALNKGLG